MVSEGPERDIGAIRLARWGRVTPATGAPLFNVVDPEGRPVDPIRRFLREFVARGNAAGSVRSYAYDLLRWWRFLLAIEVEWDRATSAEVRDFVLWLKQARKSPSAPRRRSATTAGTVNPVTRKRYQGDQFMATTVRHSNAVLRTFYEYWLDLGEGPLVNPVPRDRVHGRRPHAHHNPLEPFRRQGRLRYNPRLPKRHVRAMPDELWVALFAQMRSNRDRAILALAISTAARASELLGLCCGDVDWGDQQIRVRRKGTGAEQWLPASPDAFVWLRLYLEEIGPVAANEPVWLTLRRRRRDAGEMQLQPMTYDALRAVLRRANERLGTNWSMHDLRHTCALRMLHDKNLNLRDVQVILGHAHLTTTQVYLEEDYDQVIRRVHQHLTAQQVPTPQPTRTAVPDGYAEADLAVLLGEVRA
jgi:integrase/recombinase XerD